jgi:two-component system, LytTR family, response regulator
MKKLKVIVIDDEAPARVLIKQYLEDFTELEVAAECKNGQEAVVMIDKLEPDLIFLDVQMPLVNGFQVIQKIIHIPKVVFTTAYDNYALKAFEVNAIDYLLKPYTNERFKQAVLKILGTTETKKIIEISEYVHESKEPAERLLVEHQGKLIGLDFSAILQVEASGDYSRIITFNQQQYLSTYGISKLEQKLPLKKFIRIHRSTIINTTAIKEVYKDGNGGYDVVLINNVTTKVSRTYADVIKNMVV